MRSRISHDKKEYAAYVEIGRRHAVTELFGGYYLLFIYYVCRQHPLVHPAVPVRAVPAVLQLLLPADRAAAADPRRVAHGPLDHAHATHTHT